MNEQLVHRRNEGDLGELPRCPPAAVPRRDGLFILDRRDRRHVQGAADIGPAPANAAIADAGAAVVGQRGDPDEFANLPLAQGPEFRQPREHAGGGRRPDARHGLQQAIADAPQRTGLDACAQIPIGVADLFLEPGDVRQQILADGAAREQQAIPLSRQHLDELAPPRDQRLQVRLQVIGDGPRHGLEPAGKLAEHTGIQRVGFFQAAQGRRKGPDMPRIDDRDGQAGDRERTCDPGSRSRRWLPAR